MTLGVLGSGMATSRGTDLLSNAATEVDTNCTGLSSGSSCNVSGALAAPGLFILFFFFLSTTILHSPPSCPLGGDDNWVALPAAVVAFLGRVSQLCRPSCRRSSRRCRCSLAKARASQIFSRGRKDSPSRPPPRSHHLSWEAQLWSGNVAPCTLLTTVNGLSGLLFPMDFDLLLQYRHTYLRQPSSSNTASEPRPPCQLPSYQQRWCLPPPLRSWCRWFSDSTMSSPPILSPRATELAQSLCQLSRTFLSPRPAPQIHLGLWMSASFFVPWT